MFINLRLHSQLLRDLEKENEITDLFIRSINYPNDLGLYLDSLEFYILNKITCSGENIKKLLNLSDFLILDEHIHKKFLDYKDNITMQTKNGDKECYINDLDLLKCIIKYDMKNNGNTSCVIKYFIDKLSYLGLIDVLKFIEENFNVSNFHYRDSISYAAKNGHIETIKLLKEKYNAPIDEYAIAFAAENGQIETIKFLKEEYDAPIDECAIKYAIMNKQIETIKLLKEKYNAPIDENIYTRVINGQYVEKYNFIGSIKSIFGIN